MAGKADEGILDLPPACDPVAIRLLMHLCRYATLTDDEVAGVYAALFAMKFTLKQELSTYAEPALTNFSAAVLRTQFGVALRLMRRRVREIVQLLVSRISAASSLERSDTRVFVIPLSPHSWIWKGRCHMFDLLCFPSDWRSLSLGLYR